MSKLKLLLIILMSCISFMASGTLIKSGQTVTISFNPDPGDYGFEWTTNNPILELSSAGTKCDVTCKGTFSGTAIVKCSYKFRVGNGYKTASNSWTFTYNSTGDEGGGGGSTEIGQVKLSDTSISIQEYETQSITIEQSLDDIKWTIIDSTIASIEPKFDGYLLEITGLKPGTTYARVSGKYMYNQIIEGLVCINVSKRNYQDGESIRYKTSEMDLSFNVIDGKERTASLSYVHALLDNSRLEIPSKVEGLKVTQIGSGSRNSVLGLVNYKSTLKHIIFPSTVTAISDYAFEACTALEKIELPNSLTTLGTAAFFGCTSLDNLNIPGSLNQIGAGVFGKCTSLKNIIFEHGIKSLGSSMFVSCTKLETINLPQSLIKIESECFSTCNNLQNIYIPSTLQNIGSFAFRKCTNIGNVYIYDLSSWCRVRMGSNSATNPLAYAENLIYNNHCIEDLVVPDDVEYIGEGAFQGYKKLKSIVIPNSVREIEASALSNCDNLTTIILTNPVPPEVSNYTFTTSSYSRIEIKVPIGALMAYSNHPIWGKFKTIISDSGQESPDEFTYQGINYMVIDRANGTCQTKPGVMWEYPGSIVSGQITIPERVSNGNEEFTVVVIGDNSFRENDELTSVVLPNTIQSIGEGAFHFCTGLSSVNLPEDITRIGDFAFNCTSLANITFPSSLIYIGNYSFPMCNFKDIFIPKSVEFIGNLAFSCETLMNIKVDSANQKYSSSDGVLFDKTQETLICFPEGRTGSYSIPNTVKTIKEKSFFCSNLSSISLPNSLITIEEDAFSQSSPNNIYYNTQSPITANKSIFGGDVYNKATLYVPAEAITKFLYTEPWQYFSSISSYDFDPYPSLTSLSEAIEKAGQLGNSEYSEPYIVDFEPIVTYTNGAFNYIMDDGQYFLIYKDNLGFVPGQIIRKGWTAKLHNYYGLLEFSPTEDTTIIGGDILTVPNPVRIEYSSQINRDLLSAVVYLPDVVFNEDTPDNRVSFSGKLKNQHLIFYNNYEVPSQPAGTYDVIATIGSYYDQLEVQPIEFIKANSVDEINTNEPIEYYNLQGQRVMNPDERGIYIRKKGQTIEKIIIP